MKLLVHVYAAAAMLLVSSVSKGSELESADFEQTVPTGEDELLAQDDALVDLLHPTSTKLGNKALEKILLCTSKLIEKRYDNLRSVYVGLEILNDLLETDIQSYSNKRLLQKKCESELAILKNDKAANFIARNKAALTDAEWKDLEAKIKEKFDRHFDPLWTIARKGLTSSNMACTRSTSGGFVVGYFAMVGASYDTFQCLTPLGRRIKLQGPAFGVGGGAGVAFHGSKPNKMREKAIEEKNRNDDFKPHSYENRFYFLAPLNSSRVRTLGYSEFLAATVVGRGSSFGCKSNNLVGAGYGASFLGKVAILVQSDEPSEFTFLMRALGLPSG